MGMQQIIGWLPPALSEIQSWLKEAAVGTLCIQKASSWENDYVESFNSSLRNELLNRDSSSASPKRALFWMSGGWHTTMIASMAD